MFDRCLYFNTNHLSRIVGKIWVDAFAPLGLAPAHAYLLRLVLKKPGLLQKEIGEQLHLEKSTITRFVDKMVKQGYLIRQSSVVENVKYQHIFATTKAKNIAEKLEETGDELYKKMQQAINIEDLTALVNTMRNLTAKL